MEGWSQKYYTYALSQIPGLGPRTYLVLKEKFQTAENIWQADVAELLKTVRSSVAEGIIKARQIYSFADAAQELDRDGIGLVCPEDEDYPRLLKQIEAPPPVILYRGNIQSASAPHLVAVVGTRTPTNYGINVANSICADLSSAGVSICSGLAYGIDTLAHRAAVAKNRPTIAVTGSGLSDTAIYPRGNVRLAHEIIGSGGVLLSTYAPTTSARPEFFPQRNFVLAAITQATLFVEGKLPSGGIITAYAALEYNRDVFAVPGEITSSFAAGPLSLLKKGAQIALSAQDILDAFTIPAVKNKTIEINLPDKNQQNIYEALVDGPLLIDDLARKLQFSPAECLRLLQEMELSGVARYLGGQRYGTS